MNTASKNANCLFCKILEGAIPSKKLLETKYSYAFMDIFPLSRGHALVIPKYHAEKMHELPDEYLVDILPQAKRVASALGAENYNILQNNGKLAHQEVMHVHFHVIPKPSDEKGLVIGWPSEKADPEQLDADTKALVKKLEESV